MEEEIRALNVPDYDPEPNPHLGPDVIVVMLVRFEMLWLHLQLLVR